MSRNLAIVATILSLPYLALSTSAVAQTLNYFDATILDFDNGKSIIPANTTWADGTPFTALPNGPGGEGPPPTTDPAGNWTDGGGTGDDGFWRRRAFANSGPSGNPTIFESRGQFDGPNSENLPTLQTTVDVPGVDQGTTRSVWALFWTDTSPWRIAASLWNQFPGIEPNDDLMPVFTGNLQTPDGYVYRAYNAAEGAPGNTNEIETNAGLTTDDGRVLWAAYLGDETLGSTLTVYTGDGPPLADTGAGSHNNRTWFDGIGYGDPLGLDPLPDLPEPTSLIVLCLALPAMGFVRRRSC